MRQALYLYLTIVTLLFFTSVKGQNLFDSSQVEKTLMTFPKQGGESKINENVIRAIEAVDKKYKKISDTLYYYKSLRYTIFQTIPIETNDGVFINPLLFGDKIHLANIIFYNKSLNAKVDSITKHLNRTERNKLFKYLKRQFDNFSIEEKKLNAQPVRIRYVKFPDEKIVHVGIDIYGAHFLWTIDRDQNWDIIKNERLWVY